MKTLNKKLIVKEMAERADVKVDVADKCLEAFINTVKAAMTRGDKVTLVGFGSWEVNIRSERVQRNPKTGQQIIVPERRMIKYKTGKALKDCANSTK